MSRPSKRIIGIAAAAVVLALGASVYWWPRGRTGSGDVPDSGAAGFYEAASEAGLVFRMNFLPDEQGEKFKINLYDHGCGVAVGDFDGDGHDDVYFVNQLGPNALYRNKGDGTFEDVTAKAGVGLGDRVCTAATFADFDNDGYPDLFVTSTRGGNVLFRNKGDGTFEDITEAAHLSHVGHTQSAVFFDYDNDGRLDLLVLQTARWTTDAPEGVARHFVGKGTIAETASSPPEHNLLYHNNGDRTFTEVGGRAGLRGLGWSGDAAVFDYDGDGRLDVLITNMFGRSQLFRNNGDGIFRDVTRETLGRTPWGGLGAKAFDFNNDGRLDLYIVDMHSDMWATPETDPKQVDEKKRYSYLLGGRYLGRPGDVDQEKEFAELVKVRYDEVVFGNAFYKNLGGGRFEEVSGRANLETFWPWGIAAGDFDNDGHEDVFEPAGMGYPFFFWPNYLLMNNRDETFTDRAAREGVAAPDGEHYRDPRLFDRWPTRSSRSAAVADFDGDGRLDILVNNFNTSPYYFRNRFPPRNWITFRLTGTTYRQAGRPKRSSRDAVGATVTLHLGREVMVRQVQSAGGYLSQSSKDLHFGLGDREQVDKAVVRWPSGVIQVIERPAVNTRIPVEENETAGSGTPDGGT